MLCTDQNQEGVLLLDFCKDRSKRGGDTTKDMCITLVRNFPRREQKKGRTWPCLLNHLGGTPGPPLFDEGESAPRVEVQAIQPKPRLDHPLNAHGVPSFEEKVLARLPFNFA